MKRIKLFLTALVLSLSSMFTLAVPRALAATATWDGGGSDTNMTTAENWVGDVAPSADDDLVFPVDVTNRTVVNDFTAGTQFNSITFSGATSADSNYTISGNSIALVVGITHSMTGSDLKYQTISLDIDIGSNDITINTASGNSLALGGDLSGSGEITKSGAGFLDATGSDNSSYTGAITVSAGIMYVNNANTLGSAASGTTVASGATLGFCFFDDLTIAEPITVGGTGVSGSALNFSSCAGPSSADDVVTLSGAMVLTANTVVDGGGSMTITGALSGSYTISVKTGATGIFILNSSNNTSLTANGTLGQAAEEITVDEGDDQPGVTVSVGSNQTYIIKGVRGDTTVLSGGTLKGTGTVGALSVADGGTVAPGLSPGCLNTGDLTLGGTYQFEIGGTTACSGYDQIIVTGAVGITDATLTVSRYNDFVPTAGQKYVIISNDGSDALALNSSFEGLAEGATFTADGVTYGISYVGGDGNDVELTVTAVSPETGFALLTNSPYITMALMLGAAGAIAFMARRSLKPAFRKR